MSHADSVEMRELAVVLGSKQQQLDAESTKISTVLQQVGYWSTALGVAGSLDEVGAWAGSWRSTIVARADVLDDIVAVVPGSLVVGGAFERRLERVRWSLASVFPLAGPPPTAQDLTTRELLDRLVELRTSLTGTYQPPGVRAQLEEEREILLGTMTLDTWRAITYLAAGIDGGAWDPAAGLLANDANVQAVYAFYGELFRENDALRWAGLANLVGPMFYAGWQDLWSVRHLSDEGQRIEHLSRMLRLPVLPGWVYDVVDVADLGIDPLAIVEHLTDEELEWLELKMLDMQKQIFDDLAWQHLAYELGGIDAIAIMGRRVGRDVLDIEPWRLIDTGDPLDVRDGNTLLVRREQLGVIQDDYDEIARHDGPVGWTMTTVLTWMAGNPLPGGLPYRDVVNRRIPLFPKDIDVDIDWAPDIDIGWQFPPIQTRLWEVDIDVDAYQLTVPRGNVAQFDDRWEWITTDLLPAYQDLLDVPDAVDQIVGIPVAERAGTFRLIPVPYPDGE